MSYITLIGMLVGGWAMLSLVGSHRHRELIECRRKVQEELANQPPAAKPPPTPTKAVGPTKPATPAAPAPVKPGPARKK